MALFETEAIILRSIKLGEADKIVVALTQHEGVVRGVAKGARKLKSKYGASLEPFTIIRLTFFEKELRELVSITDAEILKSYFGLSRAGETFNTLELMAGLLLEFAPLRSPDERFFRMVRACLEALEEEARRAQEIALYFEIWILRLSGFLPDLTRCGICNRRLEREVGGAVLTAGSALVCRVCSDGRGLVVQHAALASLISALRISPALWRVSEFNGAEKCGAITDIKQVLHLLTSRALEREIKFRVRMIEGLPG